MCLFGNGTLWCRLQDLGCCVYASGERCIQISDSMKLSFDDKNSWNSLAHVSCMMSSIAE